MSMPHEPGHTDEHQDKNEHRQLQSEDAPTWQIDVAVNCEVFTSDGEKLGTIKEVQAGYFKVNVHLHSDYWLQSQFVSSNDDGRITMNFTKHELDDYKVKFLPEGAVVQGQDGTLDPKGSGDDIGFRTEVVGGAVPNPSSQTLSAVEGQYNRDHRP
jgi:hypothetical protein